MLDDVHHSAHSLLAAWAQCRTNRMIAQPIGKRLYGQLNIVTIDAKAGQRAALFEDARLIAIIAGEIPLQRLLHQVATAFAGATASTR